MTGKGLDWIYKVAHSVWHHSSLLATTPIDAGRGGGDLHQRYITANFFNIWNKVQIYTFNNNSKYCTGIVPAWKRIETDINGSYIMLNVLLLNTKTLKHFPSKVLVLHIVNRTNCPD